MQLDWRSVTIGFAGSAVVLAVLLWIVGFEDTFVRLQAARTDILVALVGLVVLWLVAWGLCLHTVLRALGTPLSRVRSVLLFFAATFANHVTPFGQAGGEPLIALLISETVDTEYENGLAAIASVDTLHFFPSMGMAVVGLSVFVVQGVDFGRNLLYASATVVALVVGVLGTIVLVWKGRTRLEGLVHSVLPPLVSRVGGVVPRWRAPSPESISERIDGFIRSITRISNSPRHLVLALTFSAIGWILLSVALWLSLLSVGSEVSFVTMLVVVPVGSIAGVNPLPGGLGGVEAAFVVLIVATTGVAGTVATAGIIVYRAATYWLPILLGGGVAAILVDSQYRS